MSWGSTAIARAMAMRWRCAGDGRLKIYVANASVFPGASSLGRPVSLIERCAQSRNGAAAQRLLCCDSHPGAEHRHRQALKAARVPGCQSGAASLGNASDLRLADVDRSFVVEQSKQQPARQLHRQTAVRGFQGLLPASVQRQIGAPCAYVTQPPARAELLILIDALFSS